MRLFFLLLIGCCTWTNLSAQGDKDLWARSLADTSGFSINQADGWSLYNSFLQTVNGDSVRLEIILRHERDNVDWKQYQFIGKVKDKKYFPVADKEVVYRLLKDTYMVKIMKDGRCYIRLLEGELPPGNPTILPVTVLFGRKK